MKPTVPPELCVESVCCRDRTAVAADVTAAVAGAGAGAAAVIATKWRLL